MNAHIARMCVMWTSGVIYTRAIDKIIELHGALCCCSRLSKLHLAFINVLATVHQNGKM